MIIKPKMNNEISSAYMLESFDVWHGSLGHVNFDTVRRLTALCRKHKPVTVLSLG